MIRITAQRGEVEAYVMEFVVDKKTDIPLLARDYSTAGVGSVCICLEDSSVWMLGAESGWKEL